MSQASHIRQPPFGMILGLSKYANGWRRPARSGPPPEIVGQVVAHVALMVWAALVVFYIRKWLMARLAAEAGLSCQSVRASSCSPPWRRMFCGLAIAPDWPLPARR